MQDDEETTPPRQQVPRRPGANGVRIGREPDEADLELARQIRETGSNPFVAVAQLARALARLEEDSGNRQRDEATETLLELPKRVEKLEDSLGTWRKILYAVAGGLVSGIVYVAHIISESAERRG